MKRYPFVGHLAFAILLLALSPCLLAQSESELTVNGTVYYSGTHTGAVHIAAADVNDVFASDAPPDPNNLPLAGHTTIGGPGPYSLTIPEALAGHSYVVVAQMDLDGSGLFSLASFQQYEPSGGYSPCVLGDCNDPEDVLSDSNDPGSVSLANAPLLDIDIYLSDMEPACVLLDTFDVNFLPGGAGGMDYHDGCLWICQPHVGGPTVVHQVDPDAGQWIASYALGDGHATGIAWIADDMWLCCWESDSWFVRQYTYDGAAFTAGVTYGLPSNADWSIVHDIHLAWDGTLLWAQEEGDCAHIYKLDLSNGALVATVPECAFTYNKWLGLGDMDDICFSDGDLWAMNDGAPTFARIAPDPNQLPPETHYTFAFDPNRHVLDYDGWNDDIKYRGMVKHGDLIYFIEELRHRDPNDDVIGQTHRIHTARIGQDNTELVLKLGGQYWFGSLSVDVATNAPWAKRGTVSIAGNQWKLEWDDGNGHHTFSSAFTATTQPDESVNVNFIDLPGESYNVAWNGDLMIHAGSVLGGGGEGIDIVARKATDVDVNDVIGDYSLFGHQVNSVPGHGDSCEWGDCTFDPNGMATYTYMNARGTTESGTISDWRLDDANALMDVFGPIIDNSGNVVQDLGHAESALGKGGVVFAYQVVPEEGRSGDLGYNVFIKKTNEPITMADIAGTYQVRFLETGPGGVPYTCGQGTCVIEAVDDANGVLLVDAYYSDGWHDVSRKECSVGPGSEFHLDDDSVPDGIVSPDKNLIFAPEYRYKDPPTREDYDWLGGIFLIRTPSARQPVYRFWSPDQSRHFYTISADEKDYLQTTYPSNVWTYETVAYYAFAEHSEPSLAPVYRFWSEVLSAHFYTIDQAERDFLMAAYPDVWAYEGPVFYAYPEGSQPVAARAVYRFWSETLGTHFYTISEDEKDFVIANSPDVWAYETIAWYAYEP